ncbi:Protein of unknown function [Ectothiorhodospira magna]|uniref:Uncharacterized protein n=1 Tax=Ectothiorhodospira magna TaxID=867345 RepID=A0A1H9E304_9GAMM|nr:DUF499 domain-containing protein [Ectothiorhodospira magna]SEQ20110.1 Protein of unknown function [Ectothiorhodospira magna]
MRDLLTTCHPRPEILAGTFNPEIFTASLSRVLSDYKQGKAIEGADSLYSDPVAFFRDATHPTQGLCTILDGDQPTLIIIDEIAQYLSRMEAAFPGVGAEQSAAFLMALSTYAVGKPNIAVVLSLASATNAFGDFNKLIRTLKSTHNMTTSEGEAVVKEAQHGVLDVANRTSEATTPVQEGDLSSIMAKRLFLSVDMEAASEVASAFIETYRQAGTDLPAGANDPQAHDRLVAHYPFHPTLIQFLSKELAQLESFQGTRGLLRTLARAVRRIWEAKLSIPLIQTGHIDLSDGTIRTELLGKTGNTDLVSVLDSDISKASGAQATSRTVAGELDAANPHPEGYPVHEWAWRVVFLHSLIGRAGGLQDEKFGIDMTSAVYEMASPAIKPATVRSALGTIEREANYLRERNGRLYADTVPTLNNILRRIEGNVADGEAMTRVEQVVRGLLERSAVFDVHANVDDGEAIPDKTRKPQLGIIAFELESLDPVRFIERRGEAVREYQNQIFLLAPSTTHIAGSTWMEARAQQERRVRQNILSLARKAIAVERLKENPENWGVSHDQLQKSEFKDRAAKTPAELRTAIDESYRFLIYPGRDGGRIVVRDLGKRGAGPTGGGSSGLHLEDAILKQLADEGELMTEERACTAEALALLASCSSKAESRSMSVTSWNGLPPAATGRSCNARRCWPRFWWKAPKGAVGVWGTCPTRTPISRTPSITRIIRHPSRQTPWSRQDGIGSSAPRSTPSNWVGWKASSVTPTR